MPLDAVLDWSLALLQHLREDLAVPWGALRCQEKCAFDIEEGAVYFDRCCVVKWLQHRVTFPRMAPISRDVHAEALSLIFATELCDSQSLHLRQSLL